MRQNAKWSAHDNKHLKATTVERAKQLSYTEAQYLPGINNKKLEYEGMFKGIPIKEKGKNVTSYPGKEFEDMLKDANYTENLVEVDGNLVTSRGPATAMLFAYKLVEILGYNSKNISDGMLWNLL